MQTITRHGGGSHYVRPDRVYRTGVLTSTMGYDPGADVQDVAASFTQYPMDLPTPAGMMSGLGGMLGANNLGLMQRMKLRFAAWRARRAGMQGLRDARMTGVAYPQIGMQLAPPVNFAKADMATLLTSGGMPDGLAVAQAGMSWDRWVNKRWNG